VLNIKSFISINLHQINLIYNHIIKDFGVKIKIHSALDSGCGPGKVDIEKTQQTNINPISRRQQSCFSFDELNSGGTSVRQVDL
jgi:hypothetical protein